MPGTKNPALKYAGATAGLKDVLMIPSKFQKIMVIQGGL
jgi:hypothetical protein